MTAGPSHPLPAGESPAPGSSTPHGLGLGEARRRLLAVGPNATPDAAGPFWLRAAAHFWGPASWMLEAAIALQVALGEYAQAAVIGFLLVFNSVLGLVQESRADATLRALKSRLALKASVLRDGAWSTLPAAELVPGDVVKLSLGGVVAADVKLLSGEVLLDQSLITGESMPVEAQAGTQAFAGALVRRGEAMAEVTATGKRTRSGRTAELVRTAHVTSAQQTAVLRVVRNLAMFSAGVVVAQVAYGAALHLRTGEFVALALTAVLAAIPVALPATFTLANALGAKALARMGVLPTRLAAIDEAATVEVLCADKTGTLTENALAVTEVRSAEGVSEGEMLAFAALASSEGGQDPVDAAVRAAAANGSTPVAAQLERFTPFDPATKQAEAVVTEAAGGETRIVKGAFATIAALAPAAADLAVAADDLQRRGLRVLAVAAGAPPAMRFLGLLALSDPPRPDSARLVSDLKDLGVRTVIVTGDATVTAQAVAEIVGLKGRTHPAGAPLDDVRPQDFAVFAGVFPEDKFQLVKAFQREGYAVAMCGDGVNDAPALRQAQTGIAVSTATDVAKSAAGLVLTEPGLAGIVAAVREGRVTYQRILTYTLRSLTQKINQMLLLTLGLVLTGRALVTPAVMVLLMVAGDFLAMASTTDNVRGSARPNAWPIDRLTWASVILGATDLAFCTAVLLVGVFGLRLGPGAVQALAAITLVFSGQAVLYVVRERRRIWSSRPSAWFVAASIADVAIISTLAIRGWVLSPLAPGVVAAVALAAAAFAFALDAIKAAAFARLGLAD